jgi:hypothetical protein
MGHPELFREPIPKETIQRLAREEFENMVKFVVDLDRRVICAGGGLHSDEEAMLLEQGSSQSDLWGANFYLDRPSDQRYAYTSMINIRPNDGNTAQVIQSKDLCQNVRELADHFFASYHAKS